MSESSGSQFYRTATTEIQLEPEAYDRSIFIMTFLTILGFLEILCSLKLVLEAKTGKDIPELSSLKLKEKFSANNFP